MLEIWCDITTTLCDDTAVISSLLNHTSANYIIAFLEQIPQLIDVQLQTRIKLACSIANSAQIEEVHESCEIVVIRNPDLIQDVKKAGYLIAFQSSITDNESLQACRNMIGEVDFLIVSFVNETNIPLELLIASAQRNKTHIIKYVNNEEEAIIARGVLESGPHGFALKIDGLSSITRFSEFITKTQTRSLPLTEATVISTQHAGMGYRGCVDTTWLFKKDEGMIVGSTSNGGLLICAEVHHLPYMKLRPFRVNAGATHSYVWGDGTTAYITDIEAGNTILAVNTAGTAYPVTVGRVKIELRPLRLIEVQVGETHLNVFLQDDWHVRVFGADGLPKNCSCIQVGDKLLAHVCEPGRHVGIKVTEQIEEH